MVKSRTPPQNAQIFCCGKKTKKQKKLWDVLLCSEVSFGLMWHNFVVIVKNTICSFRTCFRAG